MNLSWQQLQQKAPAIAEVGRQLMYRADAAEVALLATLQADGSPQLVPVCPIFSGSGLFLLAARDTAKVNQLRLNSHFALHAQVGADDLEFRINGQVTEVLDQEIRAQVIRDVPFPDFDATDPLFEFRISAAQCVRYGGQNGPQKTRFP